MDAYNAQICRQPLNGNTSESHCGMMGSKRANRKFSLDSSGCQLEISGVTAKPKSSMFRRSSESRSLQSPDQMHPEILEHTGSVTRRCQLEISGVTAKPKSSMFRRSSESRSLQSPDQMHPEILEHTGSVTRRSMTIEEEGLNRPDGSSVQNNHNKTFHKLFPEIPEMEDLERVFACALHKEVIYHGKMYVSHQHICFHSTVLLKETKVMIHMSSVQTIKKKHTAKIVPNAIAVITTDGHKYLFLSLRNRDSCFKLLQSLCPQLQTQIISSKSSTENTPGMDFDRISSQSSLEENHLIPLTLSDSQTLHSADRSISTPHDTSGRKSDSRDQHNAVHSWVSMVTEKVRSSSERRRLNKLLLFYLFLAFLLLLSSGYISLRIVALEEQLRILGSLLEFTRQKE